MNDRIKQQLSKIIDLTDEEFDAFISFIKVKKLKRKEIIFREGEVCKYAYFVNKGCLRYFFTIDGEQHTGQFFFENQWYTDYDSFLTGKPSRLTLEALEPSEIFMFQKEDLEKLYVTTPKFERFGRLMAENAFIGLRNRTEMLANQSPEERYLFLMKQRPKLLERISQHYIASYLGIKPQSLSRIRKRISEGG